MDDAEIAEFEQLMDLDNGKMKNVLIAIETEISRISRDVGPGRTSREIITSDSQLALELVYQSYLKKPEWMSFGDHNIQLMATISAMSTAWMFFILRAKSTNNKRYGLKQRKAFSRALDLQRMYHELLIKKALELGEVYDQETRWGVEEVITEPIEAK